MADVVGDTLAFAIGIALSPVPIVAVMLMLFSPRARANGPAFLLGWIVGVAVVTVIGLTLSNSGGVASDSHASNVAGWIKLALGVLLIVHAVREWRRRPERGERAAIPGWTKAIETFTPVRALAVGFALAALNPKNFVLAVGGATTIAQGDLSASKQALAVAIFVVLSSVSIAGPVLVARLGGAKARQLLDGWQDWLVQNNATVTSVVLLIMGVVLVGNGLAAFD
jgi:threonine/homoserine/homoserine lactone efflux protein